MKLLEAITAFLKGEKKKIEVPDGYCPNCWGRQEYEGEFLKAIHHENIDLNNVNAKKGWIQAYAAERLEGIKLAPKGKILECQTCKLTYEH